MPAPLEITCPKCQKEFKVPAELAGKTIKCKACQTAVRVPGGTPTPAKPAAAKPVPAKPKPAAADPDAPIAFKDDEPPMKPSVSDDEDLNPYGVQKDDLDIPRCPFCATELDPPDAKLCKNCGFDLLQRKRHGTLKTQEATGEEVFMHLLPGIACVVLIVVLLVIDLICFLNMRDWMTDGLLDTGEINASTQQKTFVVGPLCFNLWIGILTGVVMLAAGRFAVRRLIINPKPDEQLMRTKS